jgi:hypothetical protein
MQEFFHGWKRKLGLVTLAFSCALTVGWLRSYVVDDQFAVNAGRQVSGSNRYFWLWHLVSADGSFYFGPVWTRFSELDRSALESEETYYRFTRWLTSDTADFPSSPLKYYWRFGGFGVYERCPGDPDNGGWRLVFPYWSVTFPLIILSAWLLLRRPKSSKPSMSSIQNVECPR